jgi:hypothetical protein
MEENVTKMLVAKKKIAQNTANKINDWLLNHYDDYLNWVSTAEHKYFFFVVHPVYSSFIIDRWGYSRKPSYFRVKTFRVYCPDYISMVKNINEIVDMMVENLGAKDFEFLEQQSEVPPKPYDRLKAAKKSVNKIANYKLEYLGIDVSKVNFMR